MTTEQVQAFLDSTSGMAVKGLLVGAFLVFVLGIFAALRDGTFKLSYIDSFVRSTIWGKVAPVTVVLLTGYVFDPTGAINLAGIAAAGVVAAGMIGSALDSIRQLGASREASKAANTLPGA